MNDFLDGVNDFVEIFADEVAQVPRPASKLRKDENFEHFFQDISDCNFRKRFRH